MSLWQRIDFGWFYLTCGLVLSISAIVIPAHQELQELQAKKNVIQENLEDLEYRVEVYNSFLQDLNEDDPELRQRILDMQLNLQLQGTPVVIDTSASQTPLEWVAQRARRDRRVNMQVEQSSILSGLSTGRSRLLLVGAGAFAMFIGFIKAPALSASDSTD